MFDFLVDCVRIRKSENDCLDSEQPARLERKTFQRHCQGENEFSENQPAGCQRTEGQEHYHVEQ